MNTYAVRVLRNSFGFLRVKAILLGLWLWEENGVGLPHATTVGDTKRLLQSDNVVIGMGIPLIGSEGPHVSQCL